MRLSPVKSKETKAKERKSYALDSHRSHILWKYFIIVLWEYVVFKFKVINATKAQRRTAVSTYEYGRRQNP